MTETGILGGSFNPIHNGHIALARALLNTVGLDEIWFMVSPQNPLKRQADLLADDIRMSMTCTALDGEPRLKACDYEFSRPRPSYTWHTLQHLSHDYPDNRFTLLIGADNWKLFDRWYRHNDIIGNYRIVVYPRSGSAIDTEKLPDSVVLAQTPLLDISSTEIRRRVNHGMPIDGMVPDSIKQEAIRRYSIPRTEH